MSNLEGSTVSTALSTLVILWDVLNKNTLKNVKQYIIDLICIFLIISDIEHPFVYLLYIFLEKCLLESFVCFLMGCLF